MVVTAVWAELNWLAMLLWKCHRSEQLSGSDLGPIEEDGLLFEDCSHPGVFVLFIYLFLCFVSVSSHASPCLLAWPLPLHGCQAARAEVRGHGGVGGSATHCSVCHTTGTASC